MFIDRVCNASDILLFKRRAAERKVKSDNFDAGAMGDLFDENVITMEDLVDEYFKNQTDEKHKLSVLNVKDIGNSVKIFIDKDDKDALKYSIEKAIDKSFASLMAREDGLEELDDMLIEEADDDVDDVKPPAVRGIAAKNQRNHVMSDSDDDMEDIDEPVATSTQRGRGRVENRDFWDFNFSNLVVQTCYYIVSILRCDSISRLIGGMRVIECVSKNDQANFTSVTIVGCYRIY